MSTPFDPTQLEPAPLWRAFAALSRIPRGSGNEGAVRAWLLAEAARMGLEAQTDEVGNVLIRKPASPGREQAPAVALQGHMDMVCEKDADTVHDFTRDPLTLLREGDRVWAQGTTLGADNGIGMAAALSVLASRELSHGPLEALFTVDEERGLTGAVGCRENWLRARYLLNLDGGDPAQLCISCAGGLETHLTRDLATQPTREWTAPFLLRVGGLRGGHSGTDINLGRGNAIRVLAQALAHVLERPGTAVARLQGGSKRNVIPREASAVILAPAGEGAALQAVVEGVRVELLEALGTADPGLSIRLEATDERPSRVLEAGEAALLTDLLRVLPHGVLAMSSQVPGLVQTSTNLAVLEVEEGRAAITLSHRSALEGEKAQAGAQAVILGRRFGFQVEQGGDYPGWKPEPGSRLVGLAQETYREVLGGETRLEAVHAGLECGVLGAKHPGMQMLSFGCEISDAHSPQERVSIASVKRMWRFLTALLARI